jgi:hypothetical protein
MLSGGDARARHSLTSSGREETQLRDRPRVKRVLRP